MTDRCDQIVNSGTNEPTECGRTLPCEYHPSMNDRQEEPATERHRVVSGVEHDFEKGMFHGCCAECAEPWPCSVQRAAIEREAQGEQPVPLDWMMLWRVFQLHSYMPRDSMMGLAEACTCKGWLSPGMGSDGVSWDEHLTAEYASLSTQPSTEPAPLHFPSCATALDLNDVGEGHHRCQCWCHDSDTDQPSTEPAQGQPERALQDQAG